jgi:glutamate racemase
MEGILHFLKHYFSSHGPISSYGHVTHAILGCTHYPLIQKQLSDVLQCECISPSPAVAKRVFQLISTERPVLNIATPTPSLLSFQSHLSFESVGPLLQVATTLVDPLMEKKMNHILPPHFKHPSGHSL